MDDALVTPVQAGRRINMVDPVLLEYSTGHTARAAQDFSLKFFFLAQASHLLFKACASSAVLPSLSLHVHTSDTGSATATPPTHSNTEAITIIMNFLILVLPFFVFLSDWMLFSLVE